MAPNHGYDRGVLLSVAILKLHPNGSGSGGHQPAASSNETNKHPIHKLTEEEQLHAMIQRHGQGHRGKDNKEGVGNVVAGKG